MILTRKQCEFAATVEADAASVYRAMSQAFRSVSEAHMMGSSSSSLVWFPHPEVEDATFGFLIRVSGPNELTFAWPQATPVLGPFDCDSFRDMITESLLAQMGVVVSATRWTSDRKLVDPRSRRRRIVVAALAGATAAALMVVLAVRRLA